MLVSLNILAKRAAAAVISLFMVVLAGAHNPGSADSDERSVSSSIDGNFDLVESSHLETIRTLYLGRFALINTGELERCEIFIDTGTFGKENGQESPDPQCNSIEIIEPPMPGVIRYSGNMSNILFNDRVILLDNNVGWLIPTIEHMEQENIVLFGGTLFINDMIEFDRDKIIPISATVEVEFEFSHNN